MGVSDQVLARGQTDRRSRRYSRSNQASRKSLAGAGLARPALRSLGQSRRAFHALCRAPRARCASWATSWPSWGSGSHARHGRGRGVRSSTCVRRRSADALDGVAPVTPKLRTVGEAVIGLARHFLSEGSTWLRAEIRHGRVGKVAVGDRDAARRRAVSATLIAAPDLVGDLGRATVLDVSAAAPPPRAGSIWLQIHSRRPRTVVRCGRPPASVDEIIGLVGHLPALGRRSRSQGL